MSTKIKGPKGTTSINVDGKQYDADKKGVFTLPDNIDPGNLAPLGFSLADAEGNDAQAVAVDQPAAETAPAEGSTTEQPAQ